MVNSLLTRNYGTQSFTFEASLWELYGGQRFFYESNL